MYEPTVTFNVPNERDIEIKKVLTTVYNALKEKGYNPQSG